jgi:hypothetical protein
LKNVIEHKAGRWNPDTYHVCSDQFLPEDFDDDVRNRVMIMNLPERNLLKKDAIPSKNLKPNEKSLTVSIVATLLKSMLFLR